MQPSTYPPPDHGSDQDPEIEVFRAGDYGARGRYSPEDLQALADDYDRQRLDAPLTLDHAQLGPAHGWVAGLRRAGDRLLARVTALGSQVRDLVAQGAYRRCSIELIRRHPDTGRPYLRAVTLLGAATPAVAGLEPVRFQDEDPPLVPDPAAPASTPLPLSPELPADGSGSPARGFIPLPAPDASAPELRRALDTIAALRFELAHLRRASFSADAHRLVEELRSAGHPLSPDAAHQIIAFALGSPDAGAPDGMASPGVAPTSGPPCEPSALPEVDLSQGAGLLALIRALFAQAPPSVPLGPAVPPSTPPPTTPLPQGPDLHPGATSFATLPEPSASLHHQALHLMGLQPGTPYAQALLQAARTQPHSSHSTY